jgi:anthranilate synthase component I
METRPGLEEFAPAFEAGKPQVVAASLVADLETPVSALLKLAEGRPYSFLLESVTGGAVRGRYSILGLKPDLVWRCRGQEAEINRRARFDRHAFEPCAEPSLASLRRLIAESRIDLPDHLPPMAAGLFGHMSYDTVRLVERLPDGNPDRLGLPDAVFIRPTVMAIFDSIEDRVTLVTPVWPGGELSARRAYDLACERLADAVADFNRGVNHEPLRVASPPPEPVANVTREQYHAMVGRAKEYIRAGDIFQVVPSQRFELPFALPPFALYRALRRLNPSPFLFFLDLDGYALVGSSPEILVRLRDGKVTVRPLAGTRRRGADKAEDEAQTGHCSRFGISVVPAVNQTRNCGSAQDAAHAQLATGRPLRPRRGVALQQLGQGAVGAGAHGAELEAAELGPAAVDAPVGEEGSLQESDPRLCAFERARRAGRVRLQGA